MRLSQVSRTLRWGDALARCVDRAGRRPGGHVLFKLHDFLGKASYLVVLLIEQIVKTPVNLLLFLELLREVQPSTVPTDRLHLDALKIATRWRVSSDL